MRRAVSLVAALSLIAAACSSSGGSADTTAVSTTAATSTGTGDAVNGEVLYNSSCIGCHGPNGSGIEGLGKPWVGSNFINSQTDDELLTFLQVGRQSDDPLNTTGIAMMPRGGNQSLTDEDLLDLIAYMRTLNLDG